MKIIIKQTLKFGQFALTVIIKITLQKENNLKAVRAQYVLTLNNTIIPKVIGKYFLTLYPQQLSQSRVRGQQIMTFRRIIPKKIVV